MDAIPRKRAVLTLAAYATLIVVAVAQPPDRGGRGGRGGGGMGGLLRSEQVQSELELLDEQVTELRDLENEMRDRMRKEFESMRSEGGGFDRDAMRERFMSLRTESEERLSQVLSTSQLDRLKQINLQQQMRDGGARSLMGGPLAEELNLSQEQKDQLREKAREVQAALEEKMRAAREEAREQLLTVLTSEQRAKLDEMIGQPFEVTRRGGPPGGDRGRGGDRADRGRRGPGGPDGGPRGFGRGDRQGPPGGGPPRGERGGRRGGRPGPPPGEPEL